MSEALSVEIDLLLPQTQCGRCGYSGCRPYADAITKGEADINQCPPGGQLGVDAIACLIGLESKPLNPQLSNFIAQRIAVIDESKCIGCTRCIPVCPVDAIVGAPKYMHTVVQVECTSCELCLPACPVDCIEMIPDMSFEGFDKNLARKRFQAKQQRLVKQEIDKKERLERQKSLLAKIKNKS